MTRSWKHLRVIRVINTISCLASDEVPSAHMWVSECSSQWTDIMTDRRAVIHVITSAKQAQRCYTIVKQYKHKQAHNREATQSGWVKQISQHILTILLDEITRIRGATRAKKSPAPGLSARECKISTSCRATVWHRKQRNKRKDCQIKY